MHNLSVTHNNAFIFLDLPKSVEITGPTTATPGEYAHFTCVTTESFPVPTLKWKIEKSGEFYEVIDIDGDVSSENLEYGGVIAFAKLDILIEDGFTNALVQCAAVVEGQEEILSKKHKIDIIYIEEPLEKTERDEIVNEMETESESEESQSLDDMDEVPSVHHNSEIKFVKLEKNRKLWIPLKPLEDSEEDEVFFRPAALPEAPMLKQEKEHKTQSVQSPIPVSLVYSSSPAVFSPSILLALMLSLSTLFN